MCRVNIARMLQQFKDDKVDFNINCTDPLGRSSLTISIENESFEMIEVLLEFGINVSDGLLHAIDEDYVEAVELLLEWEEKNHKEGTPYVSIDVHWCALLTSRANRVFSFFSCLLAEHLVADDRAGRRWITRMQLLHRTSHR